MEHLDHPSPISMMPKWYVLLLRAFIIAFEGGLVLFILSRIVGLKVFRTFLYGFMSIVEVLVS